MKGVDLSAETGFGEWLEARRQQLGLTQREVAAAAGIGVRTLQRYEKDEGPMYEILRLLSALGVDLRHVPRERTPRATNVELGELRLLVEEQMPRASDLRIGFEALEARLAVLENQLATADEVRRDGTPGRRKR